MTSKMAQFEKKAARTPCPGCKKKRLIPRMPSNYEKLRCMNCGKLLTARSR